MDIVIIILGLLTAVAGVILHLIKGKEKASTTQTQQEPAEEVLQEADQQAEEKLDAIEKEKLEEAEELAGDPDQLADTTQSLIDSLRPGPPEE